MSAATRLSRRTRAFAVAACAMAALAVGGAGTASAAGPDYLNPGDTAHYPTWGWGGTTLCAYNHGYSYGRTGVSPYGTAYESFWVAPRSTACINRWWYGNPIKVINVGSTGLTTWTR